MKKSIITISKDIFYLLLILVILQSCGDRSPIIDGEKPFVVGKILKYNDTHSKYYATDEESGVLANIVQDYPMIVLPSRMYRIGDTIKCGFNNKSGVSNEKQ